MDRRGAQITASSSVRQLGPAVRYVLRGGPQVMAAAGRALGLELSTVSCRACVSLVAPVGTAENGRAAAAQSDPAAGATCVAALWLGPDEQLLLAPDGADIAAQLAPALRELPHSLVDVSHRQTALQVSGPHATVLLNAGCPLDLDLAAFPVGMCTRTVLAKSEIVLWRTSEHVFHLDVWRSFAAYVSGFLAEAARETAPF